MGVRILENRYISLIAEREVADLVEAEVNATVDLDRLGTAMNRRVQVALRNGYYPAVTGKGCAVYEMLCHTFGLYSVYKGINRGVLLVEAEHVTRFEQELEALQKLARGGGHVTHNADSRYSHLRRVHVYLGSAIGWSHIQYFYDQFVIKNDPGQVDAAVNLLAKGGKLKLNLRPTRWAHSNEHARAAA